MPRKEGWLPTELGFLATLDHEKYLISSRVS